MELLSIPAIACVRDTVTRGERGRADLGRFQEGFQGRSWTIPRLISMMMMVNFHGNAPTTKSDNGLTKLGREQIH